MVAPALLLVGVFTLYPIGRALWSSVHFESPFGPPTFAGLDNYTAVLGGGYFGRSIQATAIFTAASVPLVVLGGFAAALLLTQRFFGVGVLKPVVLLPWAIPAAVTGIIWQWVFMSSWGALNAILYSLGLINRYIDWLGRPSLAMVAVVLAHAWSQIPLATVFLLANLQGIPRALYEASAIDGASSLKQFAAITLPSARPMLVVVGVYEVLVSLTTYDVVYSLTSGGPGTATSVLTYYTWAEAFKMLNYGSGAALSTIVAVISLVLILLFLRLLPRNEILADTVSQL